MSDRMTIYINDDDKRNIDTLLETLIEQQVTGLTTLGGKPSTSGLFRHLVKQELERRNMEVTP